MTSAPLDRRVLPPFWLPVLAGLPLGACLLVMALPLLGHGHATLSRTLYLSAFVLWLLPLTALQRWLWRRSTPGWRIALVLLAATYAMALATRLLSVAVQAMTSGSLARLMTPGAVDVPLLFRGLEGAWLVLVAYCAIHAVVAYYAALRQEQADHLEARSLARDAELRALRYQLQPHFLFNTLHAIVTLLDEDKLSAEDMLLRLSELLRAFLEDYDGQEIPLRRELELLELYLGIQRRRFKDRLTTRIHVAPDVMDAAVPSLVLQPIVENAIRYGIGQHVGEDCVEIDCRREGDMLCIDVRNYNSTLDEGGQAGGHGIGLSNTRLRMRELYGDHASLRLDLIVPRGVACRLRLPYRDLDEDALPEHVPACA